ncbi:hypothetical protein EYC84_005500 [Monilinia fructicola]|uniref:Uncharacterized protein n=1 Tax=Monilinia fructicola TaxID=38448 RepID=A0A5M9JZ66_MONFR|nr:hypothetical protein EYC84_005500 [Monilinia fructicola]
MSFFHSKASEWHLIPHHSSTNPPSMLDCLMSQPNIPMTNHMLKAIYIDPACRPIRLCTNHNSSSQEPEVSSHAPPSFKGTYRKQTYRSSITRKKREEKVRESKIVCTNDKRVFAHHLGV